MKIHQFKTNETGLNRFFGSLEAKVMDILFEGPEMTIKYVKQKLDQEKSTNFNTVMTVMNRLVDKGILVKRVEKRTSMYKPLLSKEEFLRTQSKELTQDLMDEFGPLAVNHMLDALDEADPVLIEKLEQKIKQLKEK
ncbi:BlaI/MecI/CopY family transcriptional regulator [Guptibacillus hwajinpoensis]|uniref:BlaI/MecI/CopY family transcriptional regulator n=1 Tax=Guptibacillus hwajinpoensis TaxID=208199 RepID=UPI001CFD4FD4|nr:BlaI/MecI/CopY family transcriptional regulator [Pseudalkalibacillus hwajinpoensis]WLR61597.1 BlaI/MecI/CopY family transcriptional regulator [Pseudalkalibacillus hwajinpoensis]